MEGIKSQRIHACSLERGICVDLQFSRKRPAALSIGRLPAVMRSPVPMAVFLRRQSFGVPTEAIEIIRKSLHEIAAIQLKLESIFAKGVQLRIQELNHRPVRQRQDGVTILLVHKRLHSFSLCQSKAIDPNLVATRGLEPFDSATGITPFYDEDTRRVGLAFYASGCKDIADILVCNALYCPFLAVNVCRGMVIENDATNAKSESGRQ